MLFMCVITLYICNYIIYMCNYIIYMCNYIICMCNYIIYMCNYIIYMYLYVIFSLQSTELLTSLTVTLDMLGSELVRFAENESFMIDATGIGLSFVEELCI